MNLLYLESQVGENLWKYIVNNDKYCSCFLVNTINFLKFIFDPRDLNQSLKSGSKKEQEDNRSSGNMVVKSAKHVKLSRKSWEFTKKVVKIYSGFSGKSSARCEKCQIGDHYE